jgi:hypothetical protein
MYNLWSTWILMTVYLISTSLSIDLYVIYWSCSKCTVSLVLPVKPCPAHGEDCWRLQNKYRLFACLNYCHLLLFDEIVQPVLWNVKTNSSSYLQGVIFWNHTSWGVLYSLHSVIFISYVTPVHLQRIRTLKKLGKWTWRKKMILKMMNC